MDETKFTEFIQYASKLQGYEKGEAQLFLDRLFIAFGHKGVIEAEARLERQITIDDKTKFCDLLWPRKVLIEMKTRGEKLERHIFQAKTYWDNTYKDRPEYVILCNFDEFWIYNWNLQRETLDKVPLFKLKEMWRSLAFLAIKEIKPIFGNNLVDVTKEAADKIALLYKCLLKRGINEEKARRFTLQCLVALFADHTGLFPETGFFADVIDECIKGQSSYDQFFLLFQRMNSEELVTGGRFKDIPYFNGGIFSKIEPIELTEQELKLLFNASKANWSKVQPSIFGNIFEDSLTDVFKHTTGAHYTAESDIMRIVEPTILRPWRERIASARTLSELNAIRDQLSDFKILDPACGSGNFLYISFRELKQLELQLIQKILDNYPSTKPERLHSVIKSNQFYGMDTNELGVELAKITLSMAKKFAADEFNAFTEQHRFLEDKEKPLPFDNLDDNLIAEDALFVEWPKANAIIGNPPYQSKNKMQEEFGPAYLNRLHEKFPDMPGRADYCVYWFRKAHDSLDNGGRAGLVGTNTIRETYSRIGGLDYIVSNGGIILEAVGSMPWSGTAQVHVSLVNWIKGDNGKNGKKVLALQRGEKKDGAWEEYLLYKIPSSLSPKTDVTSAQRLQINIHSDMCYQGQTHGHGGFLLSHNERDALLKIEPNSAEVTFPYLIANELLGRVDSQPTRYVIDFQFKDIFAARKFKNAFNIIEENVLPDRKEAFERERERNSKALAENPNARINHHHENFYKNWWLLSYSREELITKLNLLNRYIVCSRVTKRPIFEFVSSAIRPSDSLAVFPLNDDYSFGILQSSFHWEWFKERCSTLTERYRYTSDTVFDSFVWPQWGTVQFADTPKLTPKQSQLKIKYAVDVAKAARELRQLRNRIKEENNLSLRDLYRTLELPGGNQLRKAHEKLDDAVWQVYMLGLPKRMQYLGELELLLGLNDLCASSEKEGKTTIGPGLPDFCKNDNRFLSDDCIKINESS